MPPTFFNELPTSGPYISQHFHNVNSYFLTISNVLPMANCLTRLNASSTRGSNHFERTFNMCLLAFQHFLTYFQPGCNLNTFQPILTTASNVSQQRINRSFGVNNKFQHFFNIDVFQPYPIDFQQIYSNVL